MVPAATDALSTTSAVARFAVILPGPPKTWVNVPTDIPVIVFAVIVRVKILIKPPVVMPIRFRLALPQTEAPCR